MDNTQNNLIGGLSGGALAAIAWFGRLDDDTQRRLRNLREDTDNTNDKIDAWLSSPDLMRLLIATVRDFVVGIAYSTQPTTPAQTIPNLNDGIVRPTLSHESAVRSYQWPPKAGQYDGTGRVVGVGEITPAALMLTFQEVRAAIAGLAQPTFPSADGLAQIYRVFHALSAVTSTLNLTLDQYKTVWSRLFGQSGVTFGAHEDPGRPPIAAASFAGLTIVPLTSLSGGVPGYPYANRNTDSVMYFRVTVPGGGVGAGQVLGTVTFGSEYRYRDANGALVPFQPGIPAIFSSLQKVFGAVNITSQGFTLVNKDALIGGEVHDITITVSCCQGAV